MVTGIPANLAALTGSEAIQNSILQGNLTGGSVVPAVSSAITGQGALATQSIISYGSSYTSGFGTLAGASAVNFGGAIQETSGGSVATLANFKTILGQSASITGQGSMATQNSNAVAITGGSLSIGGGLFSVDGSGNVTIQSATSGQRMTISNSVVKVYDSSGTLRVQLGTW